MTEEKKIAGFSPGAISSDNIEQVVAIGVAQMLKGGELIVNLAVSAYPTPWLFAL